MTDFLEPTFYLARRKDGPRNDRWMGYEFYSEYGIKGLSEPEEYEVYVITEKKQVYPEITLSFKEEPITEKTSGQ